MSQGKRPFLARKTIVVDRKYQLQFAGLVFLAQAIVTLSFQATMQLRLGAIGRQFNSLESERVLQKVAENSFFSMLFVALITGGLVFLLALWFSNRIVGPIPRFRGVLQRVSDGDLSARIHLRPGDTLEDFAEDFNEVLDSVQKRYEGADTKPRTQVEERVPEAAPVA